MHSAMYMKIKLNLREKKTVKNAINKSGAAEMEMLIACGHRTFQLGIKS